MRAYFRNKDIYILKVKGRRNIVHANGNEKKVIIPQKAKQASK